MTAHGRSYAFARSRARRTAAQDDDDYEPTQEEIDLWQRLLDPNRTSYQEFIESVDLNGRPHFWVTTKERQPDGTAQVPIKLWPNQLLIVKMIYERWNAGHAAKLKIPKDREQGVSFCIQTFFAWCFLTMGGGEMLTVAQLDEATKGLCEDFETVMAQIPKWVFRVVLQARWARYVPGHWKLIFPRSLKCRARTLSCRDKSFGRGARPRWAHFSERPHWATGKNKVKAILTVLRDTPGNVYVDESTGGEYDDFYEGCVAARDGTSDWVCLFFSALTHPKKKIPFGRLSKMEAFALTVGKDDRFDEEEERRWVEECKKLGISRTETLERLYWRRGQITDCSWDTAFVTQEQPIAFDEVFRIESTSAFDVSILDSRRDLSRIEWAQWERGTLHFEKKDGKGLRWEKDHLGSWWVRKKPILGHSYCFGCDPASGKVVAMGGKRLADRATILVWDIGTRELVALYEKRIAPEGLAPDLLATSKWYGWAKGFPASNSDGKVLLSLNCLPMLEEAWEVPDGISLSQQRKVHHQGQSWLETTVGFYEDVATKHGAVNLVRRWVREMGPLRDGKESQIPLPLWGELRTYVVTYRTNQRTDTRVPSGFEASGGNFDDFVSALYLVLSANEWLVQPEHQHKQTRVEIVNARQKADPWYEFDMEDVKRAVKRGAGLLKRRS